MRRSIVTLSALAAFAASAQPAAPAPEKLQDPPATAQPAAQPTGQAAAAARTADEAFATRVKTLEEQISDLKERVFRTKSRLLLLQETVLGGDLSSGARAVLYHRNEMGGQFVLESVAYALDGSPIFTKVDTNGDLSKREELEIFNGRIVPGNHQIAVRMVYRGTGMGMFKYMEGYRFKLQSNQTFNAEPGKVTTVKVVGFQKGDITLDLKDKPGIRYDISSTRDQAPAKGDRAKGGAPPPAPTDAAQP